MHHQRRTGSGASEVKILQASYLDLFKRRIQYAKSPLVVLERFCNMYTEVIAQRDSITPQLIDADWVSAIEAIAKEKIRFLIINKNRELHPRLLSFYHMLKSCNSLIIAVENGAIFFGASASTHNIEQYVLETLSFEALQDCIHDINYVGNSQDAWTASELDIFIRWSELQLASQKRADLLEDMKALLGIFIEKFITIKGSKEALLQHIKQWGLQADEKLTKGVPPEKLKEISLPPSFSDCLPRPSKSILLFNEQFDKYLRPIVLFARDALEEKSESKNKRVLPQFKSSKSEILKAMQLSLKQHGLKSDVAPSTECIISTLPILPTSLTLPPLPPLLPPSPPSTPPATEERPNPYNELENKILMATTLKELCNLVKNITQCKQQNTITSEHVNHLRFLLVEKEKLLKEKSKPILELPSSSPPRSGATLNLEKMWFTGHLETSETHPTTHGVNNAFGSRPKYQEFKPEVKRRLAFSPEMSSSLKKSFKSSNLTSSVEDDSKGSQLPAALVVSIPTAITPRSFASPTTSPKFFKLPAFSNDCRTDNYLRDSLPTLKEELNKATNQKQVSKLLEKIKSIPSISDEDKEDFELQCALTISTFSTPTTALL